MKVTDTPLPGLKIIEPQVYDDQRGYFFESYSKLELAGAGIEFDFVQDNQSKSSYGVIRGLHYQLNPKAQTKLVRVLQGKIWDVALDVRKGSPGYGKWYGIELSDENKKQLLIPKGFAHAFSVLSETAVIFYKCDEFYAPNYDAGVRFDDPELGIDWKVEADKVILSQKDAGLPVLGEAVNNFEF